MDIKEKFRSFIDKQKSLMSPTSPVQGADFVTQDEFEGRMAVTSQLCRKSSLLNEHILTPEAEQAIINDIESIYFEFGNVDVSKHELQKLPEVADIHVINGLRSRLRKQQTIVSRRVSDLIMQKQGQCSEEMEKVTELQKEVIMEVGLCMEGRRKLAQGRTQFTSASLGILANYSKRQKISSVIRSLRMIRTLQMTDVQLQNLLKAEDYPGAIQLLLECQKAAATFKHFTCISELSTKLQDTLEGAEEQLDVALARVVANFNAANYEKLQIAYGLLGKTQTLMDQLHMHITSHIHNSAFTIVLGYVELYNSGTGGNGSSSSFSKLQYSELCKSVNEESLLPCLLDLSKSMWNILKSYRNIITWHENNEKVLIEKESELGENNELDNHRKYTKQKLEHGLYRIWQDVQAKVKTFILASDLSHFKFDDFLRILDVMNKLINVGECFCGSKSETLRESIKKQSINYFRNHHRARMDELHMFLENEGWEACPVKSTFSIHQLMEFRFLKGRETNLTRLTSPVTSPSKKQGIINEKKDVFEQYNDEGSPFDLAMEESVEEDIMASEDVDDSANLTDDDSDEDLPDELKRDFVDEQTGETPHPHPKRKVDHSKTPIVTNTTLTILRLIGKYLQMMRLLQPIALDVMICLSHLFDYYLYAVITLFGVRGEPEQHLSRHLRTSLKRIEDTLILSSDLPHDDPARQDKVPCPSLSPVVDLISPESLYGLGVRVAAVESLGFLALQIESLHPHLEPLIPPQRRTILHQFYSSTIKATHEIRRYVYSVVASQVIDYDGILSRMSTVRWDINDLMSQHSQYVDILLRQLQVLSMRVEELSRVCPMPSDAYKALWECVVRSTNHTLLDGFASARKCTNEGRSLMQLDYQQFLMKLECLTWVRPLPDKSLVEAFIKAYYLPESALEEWVRQNGGDYSARHLTSLTATMSHISKRARQRIALMVEEGGKKT